MVEDPILQLTNILGFFINLEYPQVSKTNVKITSFPTTYLSGAGFSLYTSVKIICHDN